MKQTKYNIIANFAGKSVAAILGIVFVPIYLRYLGVESYGVIGIFTSLQTFLFLLDGGLGPTFTRELARLSAVTGSDQEMNDISKTLEMISWLIGLLVGGLALLLSPFLAHYWLNPESLSPATLSQALVLMSVCFVFQWTGNFYTGGLTGLQYQTHLNIINIINGIFRSVGALLVLKFVSPTLLSFLIWQIIAAVINTAVLGITFWFLLPKASTKGKFRFDLLKGIRHYAAGMTGISLVVLVVTQIDKVLLSRLLPLEEFGYYTLATTLASMGLGIIVNSIGAAYFPRFAQIVASGDESELREIYHQSSQILSVILIPATVILVSFSWQILFVWTHNLQIADSSYIVLSLLAIAYGLNGLLHIPYYAQLANGITRIALWQNIATIILIVPAMIFMTAKFNLVGGAISFVLPQLFYFFVGTPFMHRLILRKEFFNWCINDIGIPLIAVIIVVLSFKYLLPSSALDSTTINSLIFLLIIAVVSVATAVLATRSPRIWLMEKIHSSN